MLHILQSSCDEKDTTIRLTLDDLMDAKDEVKRLKIELEDSKLVQQATIKSLEDELMSVKEACLLSEKNHSDLDAQCRELTENNTTLHKELEALHTKVVFYQEEIPSAKCVHELYVCFAKLKVHDLMENTYSSRVRHARKWLS